jgi:hypothetical protein
MEVIELDLTESYIDWVRKHSGIRIPQYQWINGRWYELEGPGPHDSLLYAPLVSRGA